MNKGFQYNMATGRATLSAAVIVSLALWLIHIDNYFQLIGPVICIISTYLITGLNSAFGIIKTRSYLAQSFFMFMYTSFGLLSDYNDTESLIPLLFIGSLFSMIKGYESSNAQADVFNAFLCAGLGCMVNNNLLAAVPILFISMIQLRSMNVRGFLAAIIGFAVPYWIATGYFIYTGRSAELLVKVNDFFNIEILEYCSINIMQWTCIAATFLIFISCAIPTVKISYKDKVKNRSIIKALNTCGSYLMIIVAVIPSTGKSLLPLLMIIISILMGYVMTQLYNRTTLAILISSLAIITGIATAAIAGV